MLREPDLAARAGDPEQWRALVLAAHQELTAPRDGRGRAQLPWPRLLGTPPWTLARALSDSGTAPDGTPRRFRWLGLRHRPELLRTLLSSATEDRPVVVYVGSRWLPRHVLLVTAADAQSTTLYNPAVGGLHRLPAAAWPGPASRWRTVWGVLVA